jgi:hypothetical protein
LVFKFHLIKLKGRSKDFEFLERNLMTNHNIYIILFLLIFVVREYQKDVFSEEFTRNMEWINENHDWVKKDPRYNGKHLVINDGGIYRDQAFDSKEEARKVSRELDGNSFVIGVNVPTETY